MRRIRTVASTLAWVAAFGLAGCDASITNQATQVYPPISGTVEVHWKLGAQGIREVDYSLDGQLVGSSTKPDDLFAVQLDSAKFPNGLHDLRVVALDGNGLPFHQLEHTLLFKN